MSLHVLYLNVLLPGRARNIFPEGNKENYRLSLFSRTTGEAENLSQNVQSPGAIAHKE
jgi:hypothetical protein